MDPFDLALLPTLEVLLRERSVTRAARAMGRSQPAISRELSALRRQIGDPLLVRTSSGFTLTPRAETLLAELPQATARLRELVRGGQFDPRLATGTVRVSMGDYEAGLLLPALLAVLGDQAPRLRLAVVHRQRPAVEASLNSGEIALAIGRFVRPGPLLHYRALFEDAFVLIGGRYRHDPVRMRDLEHVLGLRFVLIAPGNTGDTNGLMDLRLEELDKSRFVQLSVPHFAMVPGLVAASDAVAFVPKRLLSPAHLELVEIYEMELPSDRFEVGMLWHQRTHRDPASEWLRTVVATAAAEAG